MPRLAENLSFKERMHAEGRCEVCGKKLPPWFQLKRSAPGERRIYRQHVCVDCERPARTVLV
jgi:hypothetical protein